MYFIYLTKCDNCLKETLCIFYLLMSVSCYKKVSDLTPDRPLFTSLQEVLDKIQSQEFRRVPEAEMLLHLYEHRCLYNPYNLSLPTPKNRLFIDIEGNHYASRAILSKRLARSMNAVYLPNPPQCLYNLKRYITSGHPVHRAFMVLSAYITAYKAALYWKDRTIVTNSYYPECVAMAVTSITENNTIPVPNSTAAIYKWPDDLVPPDITFFINFPDDVFFPPRATDPCSWKYRVSEAYRQMIGGRMVEINTKIGLNACVTKMERRVIDEFADKYRFQIGIPDNHSASNKTGIDLYSALFDHYDRMIKYRNNTLSYKIEDKIEKIINFFEDHAKEQMSETRRMEKLSESNQTNCLI